MKLLKCPICGNVVEMIEDHGVSVMCCGKAMQEVKAGAIDAALEKHVPVVTLEENVLSVSVGSVTHPMTPEHFISQIWIENEAGKLMRVTLTHNDKPETKFEVADWSGKITVYEYCNLHGLWKTEVIK